MAEQVKEAIFFDVDGTLFDETTHQVSDLTIAALKQLQNKGYRIALATGRGLSLVQGGRLNEIQWDGYVLNNGQIILDQNQHCLYEEYLSEKAVAQIAEIARKEGLVTSWETKDDWFLLDEPNEYVKEVHDFLNEGMLEIKSLEGKKFLMAMVYAPKESGFEAFKKIEDIAVFPGVVSYADLCAKTSKYQGILKMMEYFQCREYIAFGDGNNDLEMIEHAKIGICMGNGTEELKKAASYVTKSNQEEGIYDACRHFKLID